MKNSFFKTTIILLFGGAITKILGMIIKIATTRVIGLQGMSLYMLIFPTFALFMTLSQFSFSTSLSKLVAEEKYNNKDLLFSIIPISLLLNFFLFIMVFISAPFISDLLKNSNSYLPILAISFVLPFDCLSSILRGYFFGKQRMFPHILSLIIEQIVRFILIIFIIPFLLDKGIVIAVTGLVLVNIFSELSSSIVLILFLPKYSFSIKDFKPKKDEVSSILKIAIPNTTSRIIGSICYFLEPIIISLTLTYSGYSNIFIMNEYGIIEGYVLPLLSIPSFFSNALNSALIPNISNAYAKGNILYVKKKLLSTLKISISIGLIFSLLLMINPKIYLKFIYGISVGSSYVRVLSPFFLFLYFQNTFEAVLLSINKSKSLMINNIFGSIIKIVLIIFLGFFKIGLYNLVIAIIVSIIFVTILDYLIIKKEILN